MTDRIVVMYAGKIFETRADRGAVRAARQSLHPRAAAVGARSDRRRSRRAVSDSGPAARRRAPAARLSVRAALRPGRGPICRETPPAVRGARAGTPCRSATSRDEVYADPPPGVAVAAAFIDEHAASSPIRDLKVHFDLGGGTLVGPAHRRLAGHADRQGGGRRVARHSAGRDARPGRRIGLRQDDARARDAAAGRTDVRPRACSAGVDLAALSGARASAPSGGTCR